MGALIRDRYEPLEVAGKGGQGEVVRALDHQHSRHVALKIRTLDASREDILSEARTLLGLRPHPNLPLVREDFFDGDRYVMVVDWIAGKSLQQILEERGDPGLPAQSVLKYLAQIAGALDHLHKHSPPIIHRDVKPANVILTEDGNVVLVDFGIAAASGTTFSAGTAGFQAPEVGAGAPATVASDIYSLGATAFALLTGAPPGAARPTWEGVGADAVGVIERALRRALASDPARRPGSATELVDQLRAWLDAALPTGVVTFLLTDVPRSPSLWEEHPNEMSVAIPRVSTAIADAVEAGGGRLLRAQGEGDETFSVFADARAAAVAAAAAQRALAKARLPIPVTVRMAVHTGDAQLRDGEYFGAAVGRATRLRALAHAGQIVCGQGTADLVRDARPDGIGLKDLGSHRLPDLARPEHVFQITHPELPDEFPPLDSLDIVPNNLPAALTHLIGRQREVALGHELLADARLVTITGLGGAGKTRLVLHLAAEEFENFKGGVWFVELGALTDDTLIAAAALDAAGIQADPGRAAQEVLVEAWREGSVLVVLDTCEHVINGCASFAESILRACPGVKILATSTEPLAIAGETLLPVPPLGVPDDRATEAGEVLRAPAVELFVERARQAKPSFALTDANAIAVAGVCRMLDGIPLALELAAARVKVLTPEQIGARLDDRFRLLASSSRTALPHQQTLRATMDWSHELLTAEDKILFRRLGVFAGGCTLEAAEVVCGGDGLDEFEILDRLASLIDRSLMIAEERGEEVRYRMLQTVLLYARERLADAGEMDVLRNRHLAWYAELTSGAEERLRGPEQAALIARLRPESDDIRAALEWSLDGGDLATGVSLAVGLRLFWVARARFREMRDWLRRALARELDPLQRAAALQLSGQLAWHQSDLDAARPALDEALTLTREGGDAGAVAGILNNLGVLAFNEGDLDAARSSLEESLAMRRTDGNETQMVEIVSNLGVVCEQQGDLEKARAYKEEALQIATRLGDTRSIAAAKNNLGYLAELEGDLARARELHDDALVMRRELGVLPDIADSLINLGSIAVKESDRDRARTLLDEALEISREIGDQSRIDEIEELLRS